MNILNNNNNNKIIFTSKNSGNINFIKEIDGGEFSLSTGDRNPSQVGKRLAKSIYSSLNLMASNKKSSNTTTSSARDHYHNNKIQ